MNYKILYSPPLCHSCEGRNPERNLKTTTEDWIPVCTGMTEREGNYEMKLEDKLVK